MKTATLPICIPSIPSPDASPELWRQVAPILSAIAEREQRRKLSSDRAIATNALFVAQYLSYKGQWSSLWQSLLDRDVLHIGDAPKLQPPKPRPEIETQVIAPVAPPPKPKSDRPKNKPPKNVEVKPKSAKKKKPRKRVRNRQRLSDRKSPTYMYVFVRLKPCLSGLLSSINLWKFFAYIAPLCPRKKPPILDRPDGERIKAMLRCTTSKGEHYSLKVYNPSTKKRLYVGTNAKKLLIEWSNQYRTKARKLSDSHKMKCENQRTIPAIQIKQLLTDKWQDTYAITLRLNEATGLSFTTSEVSKWLYNLFVSHQIYWYKQDKLAYYSLIDASEFENQWLTVETAYQLAKSRGYLGAKNTFRKSQKVNYGAYGLEFRKDVPVTENSLLHWRDIQV